MSWRNDPASEDQLVFIKAILEDDKTLSFNGTTKGDAYKFLQLHASNFVKKQDSSTNVCPHCINTSKHRAERIKNRSYDKRSFYTIAQKQVLLEEELYQRRYGKPMP